MARVTIVGAAVALLLSFSTRAPAEIVSAENPAQLASIIQELGFQAKLETDDIGDPVIRSSSSGVDFSIYFYDCTKNKRCKSLHFSAGYDLPDGSTLEAVEYWNAEKRFASAYLDHENDPFLQMDINTEGGVTRENFESSFDLWQTLKGEFEEYIDFHDAPQPVASDGARHIGA